ncbi:DUF397 domain-containing protein [Streptomyces sp. NPDC048202]|uniref:DUF397 domain-containing protein n=1 Tax=unclassified Streptomyces TaxID=2593676 RepID=UPI003713EF88
MSTTYEPAWFKSSYSGTTGDNCVEVAPGPGVIHVRDSKDTRIQPLTLTPEAWAAFTNLAAHPQR